MLESWELYYCEVWLKAYSSDAHWSWSSHPASFSGLPLFSLSFLLPHGSPYDSVRDRLSHDNSLGAGKMGFRDYLWQQHCTRDSRHFGLTPLDYDLQTHGETGSQPFSILGWTRSRQNLQNSPQSMTRSRLPIG